MRKLTEIKQHEIAKVNKILKQEYYYGDEDKLKTSSQIDYQCFSKSHAIYSGLGVVRVYEYLKSVGINVFIK